MDTYACQTLRGRKAFLLASDNGDQAFLDRYRERLLNGRLQSIEEELDGSIWTSAKDTVVEAEMGTAEGNTKVDEVPNSNQATGEYWSVDHLVRHTASLAEPNAGTNYNPKTEPKLSIHRIPKSSE